MMFTGDTLLGAILIAAALGFWLGEYYGKRTARPRRRVTYQAPGPGPLRVRISNAVKR